MFVQIVYSIYLNKLRKYLRNLFKLAFYRMYQNNNWMLYIFFDC
jgi:hypothetical protein